MDSPRPPIGPRTPLPSLQEPFAIDDTLSQRITPTEPWQATSDLNSGLSSSGHFYANPSTDPNHPTSPESNTWPSSLPSNSAGDHGSLVVDEMQPDPVVLYHPQEETGSGHLCPQHAHAINIAGLLIDNDFYSTIGPSGSTISVYECQWAKSTNPCGMWITGSRARVSAHVRRCHENTNAEGKVRCLWDGCTAKSMLKDSLGRHVMRAHLKEEFHCRGCNQAFSRKDVYGQHVLKSEVCRIAGAAVVYGAECRVIDIAQH